MKRQQEQREPISGFKKPRVESPLTFRADLSDLGKDVMGLVGHFLAPVDQRALRCVSRRIHLQLCKALPESEKQTILSELEARQLFRSKQLYGNLDIRRLPRVLVQSALQLPVAKLFVTLLPTMPFQGYLAPQSFQYRPLKRAEMKDLTITTDAEEEEFETARDPFRLPPLPSELTRLSLQGDIDWRLCDLPHSLTYLETSSLPIDLKCASPPPISDLHLSNGDVHLKPLLLTALLGTIAETLVQLDLASLDSEDCLIMQQAYRKTHFPVLQCLHQPAYLVLPILPEELRKVCVTFRGEQAPTEPIVIPQMGDNKSVLKIEELRVTGPVSGYEEVEILLSERVLVGSIFMEPEFRCPYQGLLERARVVLLDSDVPPLAVEGKSVFYSAYGMSLRAIRTSAGMMMMELKDSYDLFRIDSLCVNFYQLSEARHYRPSKLIVSVGHLPVDPEEKLPACHSVSVVEVVRPKLDHLIYLMAAFPSISKARIVSCRVYGPEMVARFETMFPSVSVETVFR